MSGTKTAPSVTSKDIEVIEAAIATKLATRGASASNWDLGRAISTTDSPETREDDIAPKMGVTLNINQAKLDETTRNAIADLAQALPESKEAGFTATTINTGGNQISVTMRADSAQAIVDGISVARQHMPGAMDAPRLSDDEIKNVRADIHTSLVAQVGNDSAAVVNLIYATKIRSDSDIAYEEGQVPQGKIGVGISVNMASVNIKGAEAVTLLQKALMEEAQVNKAIRINHDRGNGKRWLGISADSKEELLQGIHNALAIMEQHRGKQGGYTGPGGS